MRGPGGSGKTVLIAQWTEDIAVDGVWVSVGKDTCTRQALWAAVSKKIGDAGLACPGSDLDDLISSVDAVTDIRSLLLRAFGRLRAQLLVVLDDFHHVTNEEVVDDLVELLVACPRLTVVVGARTATALEGPVVGARVDRRVIGPDGLAFTVDETARVFSKLGVIGRIDVGSVHHASGGSPLLLRAFALHREPEAAGAHETAESPGVAHDVLLDLLRGTSQSRRGFLLRTCIPEEFDLSLARQLSGCHDAESHLEALEASGFLMRSEDVTGPLYRYHPIIRETVVSKVQGYLGDELTDIRLATAQWYLRRGAPKMAIRHAVAAQDVKLASDILLANAITLLRQRGLYEILVHVPTHVLPRYPFITLALAIGAYADRTKRVRAVEYFTMAITSAKLVGARAPRAERAALATVESVGLRLTGRPSQGAAAARRAIRLLDAGDQGQLAPLGEQVGSLRIQNALTLLRAGHLAEAQQALTENLADLAALPATPALTTVSADAAMNALLGDMPMARDSMALVDEGHWPAAARDDYPGALFHLARAIEALETFDFDGAQRHVRVLAPHMETLEYRPIFVAIQALGDFGNQRAALGLQRLHRYSSTETGRQQLSSNDRRTFDAVTALLHLSEGRAGVAERLLGSLPAKSPLVACLRGLLALLTGEHDKVLGVLARGESAGTGPRVAAVSHLLVAASSWRAGRVETAVAALEKMAALAIDCGLRAHLALVPRADLVGLRDLAEERGLAFVTESLGDVEEVPDVLPSRATSVTLTERERVVLRALVESNSTSDIAARLVVSPNTVKTQLRSLYRKLNVRGRDDAIAVAYHLGLLDEDRSVPRGSAEQTASSMEED
ncbi:hypothetical protein GCM10023169_23070 [Georgenia halophila]|uniref:HTH luxR-type domain-containing protein n=1 Tax=Georgenia halophila TaxID=620889 RepID=A0ABP8LA19_9MICO